MGIEKRPTIEQPANEPIGPPPPALRYQLRTAHSST